MARPESPRNAQAMGLIEPICPDEPTTATMTQANARTTMVLMAVATVESVSRMPHLARMAVIPAKNADPHANATHMSKPPNPNRTKGSNPA